ncbi:MAG TPA: UDP-N-acetylglucosamine 2-epimerase (non-hydrolyzing) [Dehalococcoidia bacterium]|nr:UDP-N-acetylglucosamine 2-epimerase (non-hydrolyzing) [Dehalococcoidia bacterium]
MKILTIVGARPQFIKAVLESKELRKKHKEVLVHTGQHYDYELSKVFFDELSIPEPDYNLGIGSDSHAVQTGKMMIAIERVLLKEKPDWVLVYGDTNSTLAGALAAVKIHIPVAHVEAGPRMFDKDIPEEINRVLTDHVSSLLFAPTQTAVDNLKKEGLTEGVHLTGDIMLDSFLYFSKVAERKSKILYHIGLKRRGYLLATVHRAGNTDDEKKIRSIVDAFVSVDDRIVFPVHPRTEKYLKKYGLYDTLKNAPNLKLIEPVGYLDSITLTSNALKVLTDSGGLQKEAYFANVPCITLDDTTAWVETVQDGWNVLVASNRKKIIEVIKRFEPRGKQRKVFGNGKAAERIVGIINRN